MTHVHICRLVVLALLLLTAGCSSNNKGKIEGTKWSSMAATIKGQQAPAGLLQLDFGADGSLVYRAGMQTYSGTYTLASFNTVVFHLTTPLAGSNTHAEKVVIENDRLTMTDAGGTQLTFVKPPIGRPK